LVRPGSLLCARSRADASAAAVVADAARMDVVDDGPVDVDIADVGDVDVVHRAVVVEVAPSPLTAGVTVTEVAVSVIDAAVEADLRAPVTGVPAIEAVVPAPPARCPQQADLRGHHPGARHPVVVAIIRIPRPVARCPDVARPRYDGLRVNGKRRWRDADRNADADIHPGLGGWRERQHGGGHETCN